MKLFTRVMLALVATVFFAFTNGTPVKAAPYAAVVVDARDGRVIYSRNATQPLHPASLTKMMTLYIAFSEIEAGRMRLDQRIPISSNAASEPPSKIGLKAGQSIELRYLLRAAAIKSANDASTAIGEAIAGSEAGFANYMTQVARGIGMRNTQFKNAHGLTQSGHYSTAADMALLGRRLVYDFPSYYGLFSREYANTPLGNFRNSNIRFLKDYAGADGIKTGYTKAAGYNLVGSAKRGNVRVIVSMFGGQSSYQRNEQIGALLDLGFKQAQPNVRLSNMPRVRLNGPPKTQVAAAPAPKPAPAPAPKPAQIQPASVKPAATAVAATAAAVAPKPAPTPAPKPAPKPQVTASVLAPKTAIKPTARPNLTAPAASATAAQTSTNTASTGKSIATPAARPSSLPSSLPFPQINVAKASSAASNEVEEGSSNEANFEAGNFAIQLGAKPSKSEAETYIIATSLSEESYLSDAKNQVLSVNLNGTQMYRPRFSGMSKNSAYKACSSIQSRNEQCYVIAPADSSS